MAETKPKEQKHRMIVSISKDRYEAVKAAAEKQGISVSAWVNTAITTQLEAQKC